MSMEMSLEQLFVVTLAVGFVVTALFRALARKNGHGSVPVVTRAPSVANEEASATGGPDFDFQIAEDIEQNGSFIIKGLATLRQLGGAECRVVAIFGPARQGKSFLMNILARQLLFPVQDDPLAAATEDIYISNPFSASRLRSSTQRTSPRATERGNTSESVVAFVDTGGIGEGGGVAQDARLVASLLGLSRVAIFNWKGGLQRDNILHQLGVFMSRLTSMLPTECKKQERLGFLHIVLRDIDLKSPGDDVQASERILLQEQSKESELPESPVSERNLIRKRMKELFKGVHVWCLPYPFSKEGELVTDAFTNVVDDLRDTIALQVGRPTNSPDVVTGSTVAQRLPALLGSESSVEPSSPCSAYQKCEAKEAISVYQDKLHTFSQTLIEHYPISESRLKESFATEAHHLRDTLDRSMTVVTDDSLLSSVKKKADNLLSFHLQQALDSNRAVGMSAMHREVSGAKDRVVRRLSEQFVQDEDSIGEMDDSFVSEEEVFITQQCPWLQEEEAQTVKTELAHFTSVCMNEMDSAIKNKAENMQRRQELDDVAKRRVEERTRSQQREEEEAQQTKRLRKKDELKRDRETLLKEKGILIDHIQRQETKIAGLTTDIDALLSEVTNLKEERSTVTMEKDELLNEKGELVTRSDALQTQADDLANEVRHAIEQINIMAPQIMQLEHTIGTERGEKEVLRFNHRLELRQIEHQMRQEAERYQQAQGLMIQENWTLTEELEESRKSLEATTLAAQQEKEKSDTRFNGLEGKMKQEVERRRSEKVAHMKKMEDMVKEKKDLEKKHAEGQRQALAERDKLERRKDLLEKRMTELSDDVQIHRQANVCLLRQIDELKKEIEELEDKVGGYMANWQWQDDHKQWKSYDDRVAVEIESAYAERKGTVVVQNGSWYYEVDLSNVSKMTQMNLATGKIREIKREKMTVSGYPKDWEPQNRNFHLAQVLDGSNEFKQVEELFSKTMPGHSIRQLQRIQRRRLWREYQLTLIRMRKKNKGKVNEMELFHGPRNTKPEIIYRSERGFDMRLASKGMWGSGCYFAEKASYSHAYAHVDGSNRRQMFLAKVLTGISHDDAPLDYGRTKPDPLPDAERDTDDDIQYMYDSLNGITRGSRVHVIFDNGHAYPYYLITYV